MRSEQSIRDMMRAEQNNIIQSKDLMKAKVRILEWILNDSATPERKEPAPLPTNTDNTVFTNHMHWVNQLKAQGVTVLMPKGEPMDYVRGYILTEKPHKSAGAIFKDTDGTFGLFGDMGAIHIKGIRWEDLGLCDARCWYEWMD